MRFRLVRVLVLFQLVDETKDEVAVLRAQLEHVYRGRDRQHAPALEVDYARRAALGLWYQSARRDGLRGGLRAGSAATPNAQPGWRPVPGPLGTPEKRRDRTEAASAGFYKQPVVDQGGQQYPRLQILTVGELLAGQRIKYPSLGYLNVTFKQAPKARVGEAPAQGQLLMVAEPPAPRVRRRPRKSN